MYNLTSKLDKLLSQTATTLAFIVEHIMQVFTATLAAIIIMLIYFQPKQKAFFFSQINSQRFIN